ncbi:MAG: membrane lipoprotein lipid attachment site-containing protein [Bacilli bacterium]|nr:membrane lipoprotein lipid attachment site-containing protein [Bacilli bacterium]
MKKFFFLIITLFILTACGNFEIGNTPSRKVEDYLNKYQTLDKDVIKDLKTTLINESTISEEERNDYLDFMKNHYKNLTYEIKDQTIDGDNATVIVEITVRDYSKVINDTNNYKNNNPDKFSKDPLKLFSTYRLEELKKVKDTITYTLNLTLKKENDKWILNQLSNEDLNKINGLYQEV